MPDAPWPIRVLFVPAGAEYQAVRRGLQRVTCPPQLITIPAGPKAVQAFFTTRADYPQLAAGGAVLLGLGGSLTPRHQVGDPVLLTQLHNAVDPRLGEVSVCDRALITWLTERLPQVATGTGITCDRIITTAIAKRELRDRYQADVVEMEGYAFQQALPDCPSAVLRVISDNCHHDLPDISDAIGSDGSLRPWLLAQRLAQRPLAAWRLIRGSLQGLKTLETITTQLFQSD